MDIPAEHVDQHYRMDPATDDVFPLSTDLANGMIVLVANPQLRTSADVAEASDIYREDYDVKNRWCEVERFRRTESETFFVGKYADGTKAIRRYRNAVGWFVKLDSIP